MNKPVNLARPATQRRLRGITLPIQTQRLSLREFIDTDLDALCGLVCDRRVTRYMFYLPGAQCDAAGYLRRAMACQVERPRAVWELAIAERASDELIGSCNLTLMAAGEADLGYMLRKDAWGRGFGTETAQALIEAGFGQLALARIISTVDVRNTASIHVLEKVGLRWEATYRKLRKIRGEWRDCHLFTLAREVWSARIA